MQLLYIDESGRSANERVLVVACVVLRGDDLYRSVRNRLDEISREFFALPLSGTRFHAKDIFSGKALGEKGRERPRSERLLERLLSVPKEFRLPVAMGFVKRSGEPVALDHLIAFVQATSRACAYLRDLAGGEMGILVAESCPEMHRVLRLAPDLVEHLHAQGHQPTVPGLMDNLIGAIHFAEKPDEVMLQLADAIAFSVRRYLAGLGGGERLVRALGAEQHLRADTSDQVAAGGTLMVWLRLL